ncbi:MAG: hypothetical protein JWO95_186, partial [Verrucomicrobiales bacterium]|nr:hypothetical protein [Verrucomicrobiales bacterium]
MQIKNRQQILIFVALGALLFFVGDHLVLTPMVSGWQTRTKRIAELKKSIQQGEMLQSREQTIRERWSLMRTNTLSSNSSLAQ